MFVHLSCVGVRVVWHIKFCWCRHFWFIVWILVRILWVKFIHYLSVRVEPFVYPDVSLIPSLLAQLSSYTGEHG